MTQETSPRGAHLVGSIPLESVEDVFLTSVREIGASRMVLSSTARRSSWEISAAAYLARASRSARGRESEPTWSARKGGRITRSLKTSHDRTTSPTMSTLDKRNGSRLVSVS